MFAVFHLDLTSFPLSPSSLIQPLSYPVTLSLRRRCRKSRVHFPHFSPSWRTARVTWKGWDAEKKLREVGEYRGPRNFTLRGCETSPLRRNGPQTAAGANDILLRYFTLIPGITSLVSVDSVFKQFREQIATFCGINPGFVARTIVGWKILRQPVSKLMPQAELSFYRDLSQMRKIIVLFKEIPTF